MSTIVCAWLRWRYGGDVLSLKPPLGYHPEYCPKPLWWRVGYGIRFRWWLIERAAFRRWGGPMRCNWLRARIEAGAAK